MDRTAAYAARVRACFPDLAIRTARLNRAGQNSDILVVNDDTVFRFPRHAEDARALRREVAVLRAIHDTVPLPVPEPIYASLGTETPGAAFIGYPMLPGASLTRERFGMLGAEVARIIAGQLAAFFCTLHGFARDAIDCDLPVADGRAYWAAMLERIRRALFPHMRPDARRATEERFTAFLAQPRHFTWTPALRHGDCGPTNLLFDPATRRLTGIIDFGSAAYGDPAVDVAALSGYGARFLADFVTAYPEAAEWRERVAFYVGTFALQEALSGVEHGDARAFAAGIAPYQ